MGSSCENDAECQYGTLCMTEIQRCVPIGSLEVGTRVYECSYGINLLCQYGTCASLLTDEDYFFCNKPVKSKSEFPETCSIDSNCQKYGCCLSEYDDFYERFLPHNCFCQHHETETGVCPLFQGDEPMQLAIQQVMNWHKSKEIQNCNSSRREDLICAKEMLDDNAYQKLINSLSYVKFYPVNLSFDECVLNALTTNMLGEMSDYLERYIN
ncbi:unnamed protein product [Blepharisma stoltei]|uniref:Uncharacterized protein n=1 Tax=Blepharisma stoltei TaxID=1481888 RepID=A0AAU9KDB5_9CILI|nr:unnamed protein product [Blepharisma stoltei]